MENNLQNIVDIFDLSPMQQGMLFHALYAPDSSVYFEQLHCTIRGQLDCEVFKRAWQQVVNHHPALRTAFYWKELEKPLQVVHKSAPLPWTELDWSNKTPSQQTSALQAFLRNDRQQGFNLEQPPLMRCALIRLDEQRYKFVWSHHHILMDGWSLPLVFGEMISCYEHLVTGSPPPLTPTPPFRDYILWLKQQDPQQAESFWRKALSGFHAPTPLVVNQADLDLEAYRHGEYEVAFPEELSRAIQDFSRRNQLTVSSVLQGAWAVLLSRYSGEVDVVYGSTISGRPPDLPGAEKIVGLFINTIPVRAQIQPGQPVDDWLRDFQARQVASRQFGHTPLVDIQGWCEVPPRLPLFHSIFVFENYPVSENVRSQISDLVFEDIQVREQTNFPLTLAAAATNLVKLKFTFNLNVFAPQTIQRMEGQWASMRRVRASEVGREGAMDWEEMMILTWASERMKAMRSGGKEGSMGR